MAKSVDWYVGWLAQEPGDDVSSEVPSCKETEWHRPRYYDARRNTI